MFPIFTQNKTVVVLAGGQSKRMGTDKAKLPVMRETMLGFVLRRYSEVFPNVILSCDRPGRFDFHNIRQIYDEYPGNGPMAGLLAAFSQTDAEKVFLTAVDTPFSSPALAARLMDMSGDAPACLIRRDNGFLEPLYAAYDRSLAPSIESCINNGENSLLGIIDLKKAKIFNESDIKSFYPYPLDEILMNINRPGDFEHASPLFKYFGDTEIPVVSFVANSGTGKTTYLERLIPELKKRGLKLGVIKHDAHKFEIDVPGKDSWRLTQAGADIVAVSSSEKTAIIETCTCPASVNALVSYMSSADLVLTEGYKTGFKPKIEIFRSELGRGMICIPEELLAVVTDDNPETPVKTISFDGLSEMADMLEDFIRKFRPL